MFHYTKDHRLIVVDFQAFQARLLAEGWSQVQRKTDHEFLRAEKHGALLVCFRNGTLLFQRCSLAFREKQVNKWRQDATIEQNEMEF